MNAATIEQTGREIAGNEDMILVLTGKRAKAKGYQRRKLAGFLKELNAQNDSLMIALANAG